MHGKISSNATKKLACSLVFKKKKRMKTEKLDNSTEKRQDYCKEQALYTQVCWLKVGGEPMTKGKKTDLEDGREWNRIESSDRGSHKQGAERKKERKGGEGRFKKERTTDKTVLTQ